MPVGTFASAVHIAGGACTDILMEPFTNLSAWSTSGASLVTGRTGNAISLTGAGTATYTLATGDRSYYATIGFAYKVSSIGSIARNIFSFRDSVGTYFTTLLVGTDGSLGFYRGDAAVPALGTSAASLIAANTFYYLEVQVFLDDAGGYFTVRRNGTTVISGSGVDTMQPASPSSPIAQLLLRNISGQTCQFDDMYLSVGAGCALKGDITIP